MPCRAQPASFDVRLLAASPEHLWFDAVLPDGSTAVAHGALGLGEPRDLHDL